MVIANGVTAAKTTDGSAVRDAIEKLPTYQGAAASYSSRPSSISGIVKNPFLIGCRARRQAVLAK